MTKVEEAAAGEMLAAALTYAGAGLAVFPCRPGLKVPATVDGLKSASTDAGQLRSWWTRWPTANVAIRTGAVSGLVVLDVDPKHGGTVALQQLEREHGRLPRTAKTLTGSGGVHLYFRHPGGELRSSAGRVGAGLDVRADGGYVVAPPSIHETGNSYRWLHELGEIADWPSILTPEPEQMTLAEPVEEMIPEGQRREKLLSLAGSMRRRGMASDEILVALLAVNERRCRPPLEQNEVEALAHDVGTRYRPKQVRAKLDASALTWEQLNLIEMKPIRFADKPLYQRDAFHLLVGVKNSGKGTLLAHEAARVTRGELGEARSVIWVANGEDSHAIDIRPRLEAAGGDAARVTILKQGRLILPDDVAELERQARELGDTGLVILDPLGGNLGTGKNSNADTDVRAALEPLNRLADDLACMVFGVRHITNKSRDRGALASVLGSSDWTNVPRVVLAIVHDDEDDDLRHVVVIAGNRSRSGGGRVFRIEGVLLPGLEEPVTRAAMLGESGKDADELLTSKKKESRSEIARELIVATLRENGRMESDRFDALVAEGAGVTAKTVRNLRGELKNRGWLKAIPERDEEGGEVSRWFVELTNAAPEPDLVPDSIPDTNSRALVVVSGSSSLPPDCPTREISGTRPGGSEQTLDQALRDPAFVDSLSAYGSFVEES